MQPIWTYNFNMFEVLRFATDVGAIFAIQFQVMNRNSFMAMPVAIRERFMLAAADAARESNAMDRTLETEFRTKLIGRRMEIYTPSTVEMTAWRSRGEALWAVHGRDDDRSVIDGIRPLISPHFNLTVEMPLKAIVRGFSWTTMPITWRNRRSGEAKLKIKEMGSRYLFICLYVWLEKYFSRGDYRKK